MIFIDGGSLVFLLIRLQKKMAANLHPMKPVTVTLRDEHIFTSDVFAGDHHLTSDEPEEAGGLNKGLSPYQLVSAALGSCTAMTLHIYARHKKWPLEGIKVTLNHEKKHIEDCLDCENPNARIDHFTIQLELEGPLSDDQKKRLVDIAYKCPVHKTLTSPVKMNVELTE